MNPWIEYNWWEFATLLLILVLRAHYSALLRRSNQIKPSEIHWQSLVLNKYEFFHSKLREYLFQDAEKYKIVVTAEFDAGEEGLRVIEAIDDRTFAALKQLKRKVGGP